MDSYLQKTRRIMKKQLDMVREFHKACDQPTDREIRGQLPLSELRLRLETLREEVQEYQDANVANDTVAIADALADIQYFLLGTVQCHGMQDIFEDIFEEVHRSNMTKVDPSSGEVIRNASGKILKSSHFIEPNLEPIVKGTQNENH
jgi:predicted HAD superfamily Cof-like phosphohydrolase